MDKRLIELLTKVKDGSLPVEEAYDTLKDMPFEDLEHTKIDYHRSVRKGLQEVIFGEGKSLAQIVDIVNSMREKEVDVLVTRIESKTGRKIRRNSPKAPTTRRAAYFL